MDDWLVEPKDKYKVRTQFISKAISTNDNIGTSMNDMFSDFKEHEDAWVDEWQVVPWKGDEVTIVMKICWTEKVEDK